LAIIKNGIPVQNIYYPNQDHSISFDNSRPHLYKNMLSFLGQSCYNLTIAP